jgi:DNA-binding protein YbaB
MISRKSHFSRIALRIALSALVPCTALAALPQVLNHQGRIAVQGVNFDGNGQFKFALVNANGSVTYWSNNGSSVAGSEPTAAVTLAVSRGLYSVVLGNLALPNMTGIPSSALEYDDVRLRVWFNDGSLGFQKISPDQPLAAVPYAIHAREALAADTFGGLLAGDVTGGQGATAIADATVTGKRLTGFAAATGSLTSTDSILSAIGKLHGNSALYAPLASPTFTGTVGGITASMVGLGNVTNTSDANKPVSTAQQSALDLKAPLASPTFTGTVGGITASMVGLGNVANTSDANKPVSTAQQTALDLKAPLASPTFTGTVGGITASMVGLGNVTNTSDANKPVSTAQQTALDLKAPLASPTFTGTVGGITASMVGLGNVTNTSDANKPVSTAQQTALDLKAPLASPTFTGTVGGITASMVGLGNVTNTSDANKPVSTAQQTALDLKASLASPTFTGTVVLPSGSTAAAPLRLSTGANLSAPVLGAVEFDGSKLYVTTNAASPVRKTLAFTEDIRSEVSLASITAAPVKPVIGWGDNGSGQTSIPTLANVAAVAAGEAHSLALLDDGTVVAWGLNGSGQTSVPAGLARCDAGFRRCQFQPRPQE